MKNQKARPMGNPIGIRELLVEHYDTLSRKGQPNQSLSDAFSLSGALAPDTSGKDSFSDNLFFKLVESLTVKTIIADGERACALIAYELVSEKGERFSCEAAEIWEMRNGKLVSLTIYFDTAAYQKFMLPILFPLTRLKKKKPLL